MDAELDLSLALELVPLNDGILLCADLPGLSLPFVVERDGEGKPILVSHFEASRGEYVEALDGSTARVLFVAGFHYIDPTWIPREPHAPTEVKAVFEIHGQCRQLDRDNSKTFEMLAAVTRAKQAKFAPASSWQVKELPSAYVNPLFSQIQEFSLFPERLEVSRLMVLQHLDQHIRESVARHLGDVATPSSLEAKKLLNMFPPLAICC